MIVSGRVQGVGFRYSVQTKALEHGLLGWVKNKLDGTVEIEVEGDQESIDSFINDIKTGLHRFIRVDDIKVSTFEEKVGYDHFRIK